MATGKPLTETAQKIADFLARHDRDTGYEYVDGQAITEELHVSALELDAALAELKEGGFIEPPQRAAPRRVHVAGSAWLPLALAAREYDPLDDDRKVCEAALASDAWLNAIELRNATELPIARLNRAVLRLKDQHALDVMQTSGTAPYRFRQIRSTRETLRYVRGATLL